MFVITFMSIALLDRLLFWMRCRQLWREAKEAAERLIVVLEESERESRLVCMNDQIHKNNSSTDEENQSKEMGTREVYDYQQQKWVPYISDPNKWYQHLLDVRDGYAERATQGRYVMGSGLKYRELKEMKQKEKTVVNLVTPVAQALEMAKSELKQKGEDSIMDGGCKTAFSNWNSLRY